MIILFKPISRYYNKK